MAGVSVPQREVGADWLNITDAAAYLGVSTKTIRRWIHAGVVRSEMRPGRTRPQYVVPLGDLDARRPERRAASADVIDLVHVHLARWDEALAAHLVAGEQRLERVQEELQQLRQAVLRGDPAPDGSGQTASFDPAVVAELRAGLTALQDDLAGLRRAQASDPTPTIATLTQQVERLGALAERLGTRPGARE